MKLAQVTSPYRVELDPKGGILVLESKGRRLVRLDAKGGFVGNVELKGAPARSLAGGFKVGAEGNLYVLDVLGPRVLVADAAGTVTRQIELPGKPAQFTDVAVDASGSVYAIDAIAAAVWVAEKSAPAFKPLTGSRKDVMSFPAYMTFRQGKLYVVDQHGSGVVVLASDGTFQGRQLALGWSEGLVYYPSQICVTAGDLFVADRGNDRIQVFSTSR